MLQPHARTTPRLAQAHRDLGLALGGEARARLADRLDMPTSPDTLLRRVKAGAGAPATAPRFVGVDDRAPCQGQRYGTLLVDLENGGGIDVVPGRAGAAPKAWLEEHPGVEVISRDRWARLRPGRRRGRAPGPARGGPLAPAQELA